MLHCVAQRENARVFAPVPPRPCHLITLGVRVRSECGVIPSLVDEVTMIMLSMRPLFDPESILDLEAQALLEVGVHVHSGQGAEGPLECVA